MSITIHPRHWIVEKAYLDIDSAVSEAMAKHPDLTYMELLSIFNRITASWIRWGIKDERKEDLCANSGIVVGSAGAPLSSVDAITRDKER